MRKIKVEAGKPARNAEKTLYCVRQRKADVITDVRIIRNVILCHGRSHQQKNARFVEAIWSKKETRLSAVRQLAVM